MNYLTKTIFLMLLSLFAFSNLTLEGGFHKNDLNKAQENYIQSNKILNKVYISSSQIIIVDNGIFVDFGSLESELLAVESILCDEYGLYIMGRDEPDCGHGMYCPSCGGCNPRSRCEYRCKCGRG